MLETQIEIEVRVTEIDFMGHVNNGVYLDYIEWAREDWYNKAGFNIDMFDQLKIGTVVVNNNINYKKEARLGDKLIVTSKPIRVGKTSFVFKHEMYNTKTNELVSDAVVTGVTIDLETRRPVSVPGDLRKHFV